MKGTFETTISAPTEPTAVPRLQVWQRPVAASAIALLLVAITGLVVWIRPRPAPRPLAQFVLQTPGPQTISVDVMTLPAIFDVPEKTATDVEVRRDNTPEVVLGVIPLGTIRGEVYENVNGNDRVDESDQPIDDAVLVLDGGARSELVRNGRFLFDAVRTGPHQLELLLDTLPDGVIISSQSPMRVELSREHSAVHAVFLARREQRPEIRRTFPRR